MHEPQVESPHELSLPQQSPREPPGRDAALGAAITVLAFLLSAHF